MAYPGHLISVATPDDPAVRLIQQRLVDMGIAVGVDGGFGPDTEAAVQLFQARHADAEGRPLTVDGKVGPATWAALFGDAVVSLTAPDDPLLQKVLDVARSQIGVMEEPRGSNDGPQVSKFLASVGVPVGNAWCAGFVYWCFDQAAPGAQNPCPRTGGVHDLWRRIGQAGKLRHAPAVIRSHPEQVRPGQLFLLDTGNGFGHVGFIEEVNGAQLTTIEGNTNDGGSREGIGVFRRRARRIADVTLGVADVTKRFV